MDGTLKIWEAAAPEQLARWASQEQEASRQLAAWQRPGVGTGGLTPRRTPGFVQDWLILVPLPLKNCLGWGEGLEREQLADEARLQPRAGDHVPVGDREIVWKVHHAEEPILNFNRLVGKLSNHCVAYAVCYVISPTERNDLLLQVGSDYEAMVYLNGQEVYKNIVQRPLAALDPIGPVTLHKGTNVLVLKAVNEDAKWEICARFVDGEGNPVQGLQIRLTPDTNP
jgi:hypothetical protein